MMGQYKERLTKAKLLRLSRGQTILEVIRAVGCCSTGRLSYLERGLLTPTAEEREALAKFFGVAPGSLFRSAVRLAQGRAQ
jgi:transcriptional regulator with XRE-family HTH domain